ncbi:MULTISPECIES: hypothetical protein [unclassified Paenibacillus]|nr:MULTISPECIES: hypothetical protein [unclassified Paenibacillus]
MDEGVELESAVHEQQIPRLLGETGGEYIGNEGHSIEIPRWH